MTMYPPLIKDAEFRSIFKKRVVAGFITFMTFAVFTGIDPMFFMSPTLLQLLVLAVDLNIANPLFTICLSMTS